MTEIHLDDERLSAVVDGLADAEDEAHASSCPDCQARLQQWQRVLGQLASVPDPSPDASRRQAAISAALAENQSGLEGARKRRRLGRSPLAGLAAAVLVVGGLAFGISQLGGGSPHGASSTAARGPASTVSSQAAQANAAAASTTSSTVPPAASGAVSLPSLGTFDSPASLLAALRQAATSGRSQSVAPLAGSSCQARAAGDASVSASASPVFEGNLTYQGQPASVSVFVTAAGHVAVVESDQRCVLLAKVSYH